MTSTPQEILLWKTHSAGRVHRAESTLPKPPTKDFTFGVLSKKKIVCRKVAVEQVCVFHVLSTAQFVDIFTKRLATQPFQNIRFSLNVGEPSLILSGMLNYYLYFKLI
jgi:hypothetical protein